MNDTGEGWREKKKGGGLNYWTTLEYLSINEKTKNLQIVYLCNILKFLEN